MVAVFLDRNSVICEEVSHLHRKEDTVTGVILK